LAALGKRALAVVGGRPVSRLFGGAACSLVPHPATITAMSAIDGHRMRTILPY
jgi:hypothetical protein